jgi:alkanesulfonate monooxygenase SsuD/methylene tetrahydromethanopterin reductase-like flavin-dependent oxidoreductase (luciferase family)
VPGPQRRPVICQAGGSAAGRAFGAKHADTIISSVSDVEGMKQYRADITRRMLDHGRDPTSCKMLFFARPILADTDKEAKDIYERRCAAEAKNLDAQLALMSYFSGIDMSQLDPDEPLPDLSSRINGHQGTMADYAKSGKTLREMATNRGGSRSNKLVGSPDTVSAMMGEMMEEAGGDGFLIASAVTRKAVGEIADGLAPALRRRGLMRTGYGHKYFRDNLLEF